MKADAEIVSSPSVQDIRETFLYWECLRIIYNATLIALTCLCVFAQRPDMAGNGQFLVSVVFGAFAANVCYFAGPMVDSYIRWLGYKSRLTTYSLFGTGLLFSMLVTTVAGYATVNDSHF